MPERLLAIRFAYTVDAARGQAFDTSPSPLASALLSMRQAIATPRYKPPLIVLSAAHHGLAEIGNLPF